MANIRINQLPEDLEPIATDVLPVDSTLGGTTRKVPLPNLADIIRPVATTSDMQAGSNNVKTATASGVADAVQANVFPTRAELLARNLPTVQTHVRTSGYFSPDDGGGADHRLIESGPTQPGEFSTPDGRRWGVDETAPNVRQFGFMPGVSSSDNDDCLDEALAYAAGMKLLFPKGLYYIVRTHIPAASTTLEGVGTMDYWTGSTASGAIIQTSGAGNAARWTDEDGADAADTTPMIVAGGNGVYLSNITLLTDSSPWTHGFFVPATKQCGVRRFSAFGFTRACIRLDLTWSDRNTTLKTLHTSVTPDAGCNEFSAIDFWMFAGTGGYAIDIKGTTRAHDSVATESDWLWGWGGASDVRFAHGRLTGTSSGGGEIRIDGQLYGAANAYLQGQTFRDVALRGNGAGYSANLDRANRVIFDGCYGEDVGGGNHAFNVTTRTQASVDGVTRVSDKLNVPIYLDGSATGFSGSTVPWSAVRCIVTHRADGREYTPNFETGRSSTQINRIVSWATGGEQRFSYDNGSAVTDYFRVTSTLVRPETASAINLGSSGFPFGALNCGGIVAGGTVRPSVDNSSGCGTASFRWTQLFAATATIGTSDERTKQQIATIREEILDAWSDIEWVQFKFNDAVAQKGEQARWHFGLIAQRVAEILWSHGVNGFEMGLLCWDCWDEEWHDEETDEEFEATEEDGSTYLATRKVKTGRKIVTREAGEIYGLRYEAAFAIEAAYQRRRANRIESRLTAIEQALAD